MSGYQGVNNTVGIVAEEFFWPGMQGDIKRYVRSCNICQRAVKNEKVDKVPLDTMPKIATPFQREVIDLIGTIASVSNSAKRYISTVVDVATRCPEAVALE